MGRATKGDPRQNRAFTLIEAAIILVIVGLIAAAVFPRIIKTVQKESVLEGKDTLRAAREEIIGFAIERCCLPDTRAEGLGHLQGRWVDTLIYRNATELGCATLEAANQTIQDVTTPTTLSVNASDGVVTDDIAFYLASPGKDGQPNQPYDTDIAVKDYRDEGPAYYDDLVDFVTREYLREVTDGVCGGDGDQPPPPPPGGSASEYVLSGGSGGFTVPNSGEVSGDINSKFSITINNQGYVDGSLESNDAITVGNEGVVSGDVVSNSTVTLNNKAKVYGDVNATGDVTIGSNARVYGSVYTKGSVSLSNGAIVFGEIHAVGSVTLGSSSASGGDIVSNSTITLGSSSSSNSSLHAKDGVTLRWNAYVEDEIYIGNSAFVNNSGQAYTANTNSPVPPRREPTLPGLYKPVRPPPKETSFTTGTQDRVIGRNEEVTITPGEYGIYTSSSKWTNR